MEDKKTLEELFLEIEEIHKKLEDSQLPLEKAMAEYEKGMGLIKLCQEQIDQVEKKMLVIREDGKVEEFQ